MTSKITFTPVGNGDQVLIRLNDADETSIAIDCNIRELASDGDNDVCDAAKELRKRLKTDGNGRPYVDVFMLSDPDADHCRGLDKHFHLGPIADYNDKPPKGEEKKIVIRELWSSPIVFRRASKKMTLCDDAQAFATEARRRVQVYRDKKGYGIKDGDRILIMGEDENGKTDDLAGILVKVDTVFDRVNGKKNTCASMRLLGPLPAKDKDEEEVLEKNDSSIVMQFSIAADEKSPGSCLYLTGGDAGYAIWSRLWQRHKASPSHLEYDILLTPHHCSWHSLSAESWGDSNGKAKVDPDAKSALSQARSGAIAIASSKPIKDDDDDPPSFAAREEYKSIDDVDTFVCTEENPSVDEPAPYEIVVTSEGPQKPGKTARKVAAAAAAIFTSQQAHSHGDE